MDLDITRFLGATQREFSTREFQGKTARVIVIKRTFPTDQKNIWDALTNPERLPKWFLPLTGGVNPGDRYQLEGNAGGEVLLCKPQERFEITWEMGEQMSWVNVELKPTDSGVDFQLEHIAHIPEDDSFWGQYGPGAVGVGWELGILGLDQHLLTGNPNDAEQFMAWVMQPDGKKLIAGSSNAWGKASAAGGTDTEAAQLAAKNTTAFYTGEPQPE